MKNIFLILQLLLLIQLFSSDNNFVWNQNINWEENTIEIEIKSPLDITDSTLSTTRLKAENAIKDNFTNIFLKGVLSININSLENVSDVINREPGIYYKVDNLGESLTPIASNLSTNIEYLNVVYKYSIYPDLVQIFYSRSQNKKILKKLDHHEYGYYTGLIIYVENNLPLYKKGEKGNLTKVLFPKIYNQDMEIILDETMIEPDYMEKWGMVVYSSSFNEIQHQSRIGISPLRIAAKELFGKKNSDVIISTDEANKIIGNNKNLNVITQGRILIIN